jgi:hypothetical protein
MQTLNGAEVRQHRQVLLGAIESFVARASADLVRRGASKAEFHYYASFFSPAVFDLVAWEQISRVDLKEMPQVKAYFCDALVAARATQSAYGWRDKELHRGDPRRSYGNIASAELAVNVLPRLENLLNCWGILVDADFSGENKERELSEDETERLTRNYHAPI